MTAKNRLIIVESPSKARTLTKFLGKGFTIKASMGHVRDLPKSKLGVDVESGFVPHYVVIKGKEKQIEELQKAAKKASSILLAPDPDREGEAIAWHLAEALELKDPERIIFHEITKTAVEAALAEPKPINQDLVSAQEARRVIDRLIGYQLSPLLWKKVRRDLSAGRVQSVAVRLVVDREAEIEAFISVESWTIDALLSNLAGQEFVARLWGRATQLAETDNEAANDSEKSSGEGPEKTKFTLANEDDSLTVAKALAFDDQGKPTAQTPPFKVVKIESRATQRNAPNAYTTSGLQQDGSSRLRLSPKRTMRIAQELYEGIDLGDQGATGLITYMRTDSTRISDIAKADAAKYITGSFGNQYLRTKMAKVVTKPNVQDAHEAIRPTDVTKTPENVAQFLSAPQLSLYELIWRRYVASQMSAAKYEITSVYVEAGDYLFRASGSVLKFDGFTKVWRRDNDKDEKILPALIEDELLKVHQLNQDQHFTQPPPRYSEASLIKELEERGIGRPSTYAPTIDVVQQRNYVRQEERRLHPTALGTTVDSVLRQHFPDIVDVDFTADLEKRLDSIEAGRAQYEPTVRQWYGPFAQSVDKAEKTMERVKVPVKDTGEACPECGEGQLVIREGRFGEFVGCNRYPDCKYIKGREENAAEPTGEDCPECSKPLVTRHGRRGPFVGCSGYPNCRFIKSETTLTTKGANGEKVELGKCPECGKQLVQKMGRRGPFIGCSGYPACRHIESSGGAVAARATPELTGEKCPDCGNDLVKRQGRYGPFVSCAGYPKCKYRPPKAEVSSKKASQN